MRFRKLTLIVAAACLAAGITSLSALPVTSGFTYQDIDAINLELNAGDTFTGVFSITDGSTGSVTIMNGYDPSLNNVTFTDVASFNSALETIVSATVFFYIRSANSANDLVTVSLTSPGLVQLFSGRTQDDKTIIESPLASAQLTFLNNNGTLGYQIINGGSGANSDFTIHYAQLQVVTRPNSSQLLPDGGSTCALLALACLGLAALNRKLRR